MRYPGPPPDDLLAAIDRAVEPLLSVGAHARNLTRHEVSSTQLQALLVLEAEGPLNPSGLAEAMNLLPSSATRLCQRLVAAGLVTREPGSTDRREVVVALTGSGLRLVQRVREHRRDRLGVALAALDEREQRAVLRGLTLLSDRLRPSGDSRDSGVRNC